MPLSLLAFQFASPGSTMFQLGPLTVRWYGFLIASAVLTGVLLSQFLAKRRHIDPELVGDLAIWLVIGAIPGARAYYVLFNWETYAQHPDQIIAIWRGGIAIHGALLGGTIAAWIFAKINQVSFWQLMDVVSPAFILGQAIGRWGNFFNSEAFGAPTDLPWKLYIPPDSRPWAYRDFEYFHPTFLYESLWDFGVFALLIFLFFRSTNGKFSFKPGTLFLIYLASYSLGRFWIEGLRTDSLMLGPLRMAQVVSLLGILLGTAGLVWLYRFDRSLPDVVKSGE